MSAKSAFRRAAWDFIRTIWAGGAFLGFYLLLVGFGPSLDGRFFPVIVDYRLVEPRHLSNGAITFYPEFTKVRDCTYFGMSWFAPDQRGNLVRLQSRRAEGPVTPPETGPMGPRRDPRQYIAPPADASQFFGIMHHQCGPLWQTRTQVGPFSMQDGRLVRP